MCFTQHSLGFISNSNYFIIMYRAGNYRRFINNNTFTRITSYNVCYTKLLRYQRAFDVYPRPQIYWLIGLAEQRLGRYLDDVMAVHAAEQAARPDSHELTEAAAKYLYSYNFV